MSRQLRLSQHMLERTEKTGMQFCELPMVHGLRRRRLPPGYHVESAFHHIIITFVMHISSLSSSSIVKCHRSTSQDHHQIKDLSKTIAIYQDVVFRLIVQALLVTDAGFDGRAIAATSLRSPASLPPH